jgi:uncharacterized protein YjiS (DUF1127 family)
MMIYITAVLSIINRWREVRRITNELAQMDDRELRELGINRVDIGRVARGEPV